VFVQNDSGTDAEPVLTRPLPAFAQHATLASVNLWPATDGLVRSTPISWRIGAQLVPSVAALASGTPARAGRFRAIDFSIAPSSFTYFSYSDVLEGRVPASAFSGKTVFVGATAVELGDRLAVPLYHSLPGVEVLALASQTLDDGPLRAPPAWLYWGLLGLWGLAGGMLFRACNWRRGLAALAAALVAVVLAAAWTYAKQRLVIELAPVIVLSGAVFLLTTLRSLDEQTVRAYLYRIGLQRRDALLNTIVESSADCIVCIDGRGRIQTANPAALQLFAPDTESLDGAQAALFLPSIAELCARLLTDPVGRRRALSVECDARDANGLVFPVELSLSLVRLHEELLYSAVVRDIRERYAQQRALEHRATHDELTGLPNRPALIARLQTLMGETHHEGFKDVNDTLGHNVGDLVLQEVAKRFARAAGEEAFVARLGGDEFAVLIPHVSERAHAAELCVRLGDSLRESIEFGGVPIDVGVSSGIAMYPRDATDAQTLLQCADVAMYQAKRRGATHEYYDASYNEHSVRRLTMVSELRQAIARGTIRLCYQPQVNLATGGVDCVEALMRWRHPTFGDVSPSEFIGVAEASDLIWPLTEWTLQEAVRQVRAWRAQGLAVRVGVNMSARMLQDRSYPERLTTLVSGSGIDSSWLELEITESAMMADPQRAQSVLQRMHELGLQISVDDFGTGFSSLAYLRDLPVDALKVDKSFVVDMHERSDNRIIVDSTAQMAHALNLRVIAEGVESRWHAEHLASVGFDHGQGYYFSAALPPEELQAWIGARSSSALPAAPRAQSAA
jgi:diguanylate cyclase (GGDEF)-like protein/PAS domain S-box-containing protein